MGVEARPGSVKDPEAQIKELQEALDQLRAERDELKGKLDRAMHEWTNGQATIRALHWALSYALKELRKAQLEQKKFGADSVEWVAIAE